MTSNAHQAVAGWGSQPIGDWPPPGWPQSTWPYSSFLGSALPSPLLFPPSCPYCCMSYDTWARNGGYCCEADYRDRHNAALAKAAAFLRLHGYTVTEPAEKPSTGEGEAEDRSDGPWPA
jgi:hypothetical protein